MKINEKSWSPRPILEKNGDALFPPASRTGFELELLAPPGRSRRHLADALATRINGKVLRGFKYSSEGLSDDGRPICSLSPAFRVLDDSEECFATLVDDTTIRADLDASVQSISGSSSLIMDDLRLALWTEGHCWVPASADESLPHIVRELLSTFDASIEKNLEKGLNDKAAKKASHIIKDPWGHVLALVTVAPLERARVCEVVTKALLRQERRLAINMILEEARALAFSIPKEAALHLHFDGSAWRQTDLLVQLILAYDAHRARMISELKPNAFCRKLGPMPTQVVEVARQCPSKLPFATLAAALNMAGVRKEGDLNIKWLVDRFPVQNTLEYRALPMSLDAREIFDSVTTVENFLLSVFDLQMLDKT